MDIVKFGLHDKVFGFLSNFYTSPIEWKGKTYPTVEHLYQALKAIDEKCHEYVRSSPGPGTAKQRGREIPNRPDWENIKVTIMRICLRLKFAPGSELSEWLSDTQNLILVEEAPWDEFWGSGREGNGKNILGVLLMEIREDLRQGEYTWQIKTELDIGQLDFAQSWIH
jgi:ribA/ribD-fused uncharacterized protein